MAKNVKRESKFAGLMEDLTTQADTHTHTDVYEVEPEPVPNRKKPVTKKERKQRRVQLLTYDSLIDRVDDFAETHDMSRVEVIESAIRKFLAEFDADET